MNWLHNRNSLCKPSLVTHLSCTLSSSAWLRASHTGTKLPVCCSLSRKCRKALRLALLRHGRIWASWSGTLKRCPSMRLIITRYLFLKTWLMTSTQTRLSLSSLTLKLNPSYSSLVISIGKWRALTLWKSLVSATYRETKRPSLMRTVETPSCSQVCLLSWSRRPCPLWIQAETQQGQDKALAEEDQLLPNNYQWAW